MSEPTALDEFMAQATEILEASRAKRGDGLRMETDVTVETEGDDADPDGDDEDESGEEDESPDPEPFVKDDGKPFTKADHDALQTALAAARKEARTAKRAAKGKPADKDAAATEAAQAAEAKYKPIVVKTAARGALAEAGLILPKGKEQAAIGKALKLLDMDEIDLTDDGDVEGLEEQIDELKGLYPELFARKGTRRVDGADRGTSPAKGQSSADALAGLLTG